jgi:hypothetical protein
MLPHCLTSQRGGDGRLRSPVNPLITLKALSYFDDLPGLSLEVRTRLAKAAAAVDTTALPVLTLYMKRREEID